VLGHGQQVVKVCRPKTPRVCERESAREGMCGRVGEIGMDRKKKKERERERERTVQ